MKLGAGNQAAAHKEIVDPQAAKFLKISRQCAQVCLVGIEQYSQTLFFVGLVIENSLKEHAWIGSVYFPDTRLFSLWQWKAKK